MEMTVGLIMWLGLFIGGLPRLGWLLWWWNELWYVAPLQARCSATGTKLPPGHMGFPLLGEMLTFLWYFKILRRLDEFINSKRRKLQYTKGLESDCVDSIYLHTNPENFEDPMCFNPDRWNEPARPGTYQVFGGGSRICAGNMLARIQLALFLHHLSVGYKWELLNPDVEMVYLPHPIPADGVEVAFTKF